MDSKTIQHYGSNSILSQPSVKFFISQIMHGNIIAFGNGHQCLQLKLRSNGQKTAARCVWVQGDLMEWRDNGDTAVLDDGTGTARIHQIKRIFSGQQCKIGSYVMVIGELLNVYSDYITLRALKVANLSMDPDSMTLWVFETIDLHQTIFDHS